MGILLQFWKMLKEYLFFMQYIIPLTEEFSELYLRFLCPYLGIFNDRNESAASARFSIARQTALTSFFRILSGKKNIFG